MCIFYSQFHFIFTAPSVICKKFQYQLYKIHIFQNWNIWQIMCSLIIIIISAYNKLRVSLLQVLYTHKIVSPMSLQLLLPGGFLVLISFRDSFNPKTHSTAERIRSFILILGVCILLRVRDQGERVFPSTQRYNRRFLLIYFYQTATCFGHTTIFKQKYIC
jgi:hypothetical protein